MENIDFATLFQGIGTMMASGWFLRSEEHTSELQSQR